MRTPVAIAAVALAALVAFGAFTLGKLGGALRQLQAFDALTAAPDTGSAARDAGSAAREPVLQGAEAPEHGGEPTHDETLAAGIHAPNVGDEHIRQWLAADSEFRRAADELLQDPDPQVQQEARQLLRELGALDER